MATSVVVGVDIGTSSAKGAAYDLDGRCLGATEIAYRYETPRRGWAEADAGVWWRATCRILRALADTVRPAQIDGVAVHRAGPDAAAGGRRGRPLRPAILWLDVRTDGEVARSTLARGWGRPRASGSRQPVHAYYPRPQARLAAARTSRGRSTARHHPPVARYPVTAPHRRRGVTDYSSAALCARRSSTRARARGRETCASAWASIRLLPEIMPATHRGPSHARGGRRDRAAEGTPGRGGRRRLRGSHARRPA